MTQKKKMPRRLSDWNRYVQKRRLQGATLKTIAAEWKSGKRKTPIREPWERAGMNNRGTANLGKSKSPRRPQKAGGARRQTQMAKKKSYRRRVSAALKPQEILIGGAAYSLIEPKLNEMTRGIGEGIPDDIVKLVGGYYATKQKNKVIKGIGYAAMFHGVRNLTAGTLGVATGATSSTKPSGLLF